MLSPSIANNTSDTNIYSNHRNVTYFKCYGNNYDQLQFVFKTLSSNPAYRAENEQNENSGHFAIEERFEYVICFVLDTLFLLPAGKYCSSVTRHGSKKNRFKRSKAGFYALNLIT